jgi:hypothetical protein
VSQYERRRVGRDGHASPGPLCLDLRLTPSRPGRPTAPRIELSPSDPQPLTRSAPANCCAVDRTATRRARQSLEHRDAPQPVLHVGEGLRVRLGSTGAGSRRRAAIPTPNEPRAARHDRPARARPRTPRRGPRRRSSAEVAVASGGHGFSTWSLEWRSSGPANPSPRDRVDVAEVLDEHTPLRGPRHGR